MSKGWIVLYQLLGRGLLRDVLLNMVGRGLLVLLGCHSHVLLLGLHHLLPRVLLGCRCKGLWLYWLH